MNASHSHSDYDRIRWLVLGLLSLVMFGNYYVYDAVGPVAEQLERELGFSDIQIGWLNAIYSVPNIFLVLVGGIIVDRFGAARITVITTAICLAGAILTAASGDFNTMVSGRFLFGIGAETMLVAATVAIGLWFSRAGVAFAMALSLSVARLGSYVADVSPVWASAAYDQGWQAPLIIAAVLAAVSLLAAVIYWYVDKVYAPPLPQTADDTQRVQWRDVLLFNRSFWYILGLTVLFYAVIFPFRSTFAIKYFQHAHDLELASAATINSYVFLAAVFATPLFGWISDRYGHRATMMVFGSLLLPLSFVGLGISSWGLWVSTVLLGISFSLIPAVLWPSVVKLVAAERLGTAYGLLFMLQNLGMAAANIFAGWLNDINDAGAANPAGYAPMLTFFAVLAVLACVFSLALWRRERGPEGHGLEKPDPIEAKPVGGLV
ncbi:MAG: MFS transporter [Halieaceae bacterium]